MSAKTLRSSSLFFQAVLMRRRDVPPEPGAPLMREISSPQTQHRPGLIRAPCSHVVNAVLHASPDIHAPASRVRVGRRCYILGARNLSLSSPSACARIAKRSYLLKLQARRKGCSSSGYTTSVCASTQLSTSSPYTRLTPCTTSTLSAVVFDAFHPSPYKFFCCYPQYRHQLLVG